MPPTDVFNDALRFPDRRLRALLLVLTYALIPIIAWLHFLTGPQVEFHIFFLLPVLAAAWLGGPYAGSTAAVFALASWMTADWLEFGQESLSRSALFNDLARLAVFLLTAWLTSRLRLALQREIASARTDPLTGLSNRRNFIEATDREIQRSARSHEPLTLFFIDLDHFKAVNDQQGHAAGDKLLKEIAQCLSHHVRPSDTVGRLGGDEFAVLCPALSGSDARLSAERLHGKLIESMETMRSPVTFSLGAASFHGPMDSATELISVADALMYEVKREGRNAVRHARYGEENETDEASKVASG
jgi:diguanylate cyclase (GGDEF)-like protein